SSRGRGTSRGQSNGAKGSGAKADIRVQQTSGAAASRARKGESAGETAARRSQWVGRGGRTRGMRKQAGRSGGSEPGREARGDGNESVYGRRPTRRCTGAAGARFLWLLVRPFGGQVMRSVGRLARNHRRAQWCSPDHPV